jgi:hypothetical protein
MAGTVATRTGRGVAERLASGQGRHTIDHEAQIAACADCCSVLERRPRRRRPQVVEEVVRPARFERATYRFVARTGEKADHDQDDPSTTKDGESDEDGNDR